MKRLDFFIKQTKETGLKSGFTDLDKITSGWKAGDLIVVGGRPAMGKTAFAISMIKNIAIDNRIPVGMFSLEMSTAGLTRRFMHHISGVKSVRSPGKEEQILLDKATKQLDDAPVFIDDTPMPSIYRLREKAYHLVRKHQVKLIIIDYFDLLNASGATYSNRREECEKIIRSLKELALELEIPVIVLAQLNRSEPTGRFPRIADFRNCDMDCYADVICLIHRLDYYGIYKDDKGNDTRDLAIIHVAKHRNGKTENVYLKFLPENAGFQNVLK